MSLSASPPLCEEIEAEKGHAASLATVLWNLTIASMKVPDFKAGTEVAKAALGNASAIKTLDAYVAASKGAAK